MQNDRPVYPCLISEQLAILNPENRAKKNNSSEYSNRVLKQLLAEEKVSKNTQCPHCKYDYGIKNQKLPEFCVDCHQPLFPQYVKFEKKSNRPYFTVILTESGQEELKDIIDSFFKACYFCIEWLKFSNSKP